MILDLHVRNLAVLERATVEFDRGLNVLTGETGAGKSIVVDALALLRGARASGDLLRTGADRLVVIGRFTLTTAMREVLDDAGVEGESDECVVRREIGREGRNRVFVNDQPATVRLLRALTEECLYLHAQREELTLATAETQRDFVDGRGGEKGRALLDEVAAKHALYRELATRLERVRGNRRLHEERIDLLRFQIGEIDSAGLTAGEDDELAAERARLRHSEQIASVLGRGHLELAEEDGAAVERIARAENALRTIAEWEPEAEAWSRELEELRIRLEEAADGMRRALDSVAADPRRLDQVEERLSVLDRLRRKFGERVADVLDYRREAATELEGLEADLEDGSALEDQVTAALEAYRKAATRLSKQRKAWAKELVEATQREFASLALDRARLSVELRRRSEAASPLRVEGNPVAFGPLGYDDVELFLAANPGEEPRPLATSASGGELSRIFLALRLAARTRGEGTITMVFDEADAGLGGEAASALGRKLQELAEESQVLAVTHLPQVASFADVHLGVRKAASDGRTRTTVERLDQTSRTEEIARMLAGDRQTETARSHAEELIESSKRGAA